MPQVGAGRRYAEAAFEIAVRDGTVDAWRRDLATAAAIVADERAGRAIDNPAVGFAQRRRAVEELLAKRVSRQALNLALLLAGRGRFAVLPQVSASFDALVRRSQGIKSATVTSAAPLSREDAAAVEARVRELAGGPVELHLATDPSLIGGLTVRIEDRLIDASVRGRLERLRERLIQGSAT